MADIEVERNEHDHEHRGRRRDPDRKTNWPLWLLVPLGIFGLVAVTQLDDRRNDTAFTNRSDSTQVLYRGQALSNAGASEVSYPDNTMVQVGSSDNGVVLYRHKTQPWAGGGGGATMPSTTNPLYMKTGDNTYLPLKPVGKAPAGGMAPANNSGGVGAGAQDD